MTIELANRLAELRKNKGLSQEELASRLGVSRQAISKWECAEASPDTDNLLALASIYGVSLDELVNDQDEEKNNKDNVINVKINSGFSTIAFPILFSLALISYILLGCFTEIGWAWGWTLLLDAIWLSSLYKSIKDKSVWDFSYPILVTSLYCKVGFLCSNPNWGNFWPIFLTIPLYYSIVSILKNKKKNK